MAPRKRREQVSQRAERGYPKTARPIGIESKRESQPRLGEGKDGGDEEAAREILRDALRGGRGSNHQGKDQQYADDLCTFGGRQCDDRQKQDRE